MPNTNRQQRQSQIDMNDLCNRCNKNAWVASVFLGAKPTEQWCDDCIQAEIDSNGSIEVLGNYFEVKKQKEVMRLLDEYILMDNRRFAGLPGNSDTNQLTRIRELLVDMWGE